VGRRGKGRGRKGKDREGSGKEGRNRGKGGKGAANWHDTVVSARVGVGC